jgi:hypothetical protein
MNEQDLPPPEPTDAITARPKPAEDAITAQPPAAEPVTARKVPEPELDTVSFSNGIRLSFRQWIGVGVFTLLMVLFASPLWKQYEKFELEPDYRIPHDLGNDYWLYERFAGLAAEHDEAVVIGDSVVWGEYVTRQETLSFYLNEMTGHEGLSRGSERFANLGLDGAHPLALLGLVEYYGGAVRDKTVLLQCNPLWMSSPRADLQEEKATEFNHPRLVPQGYMWQGWWFVSKIPSYKEEASTRLGVLVEERVPFSEWTNHLQQAYYDRSDMPSWTLEHPYDNPIKPLTKLLPPSDNTLRHVPQPWFKSGIKEQDYPWVDMNTSLQWHAFQQVVDVLERRGNRVFVLVGPFNEHLLEPASAQRYQKVKATITAWLQARKIPHAVPSPLPSELYGDASHPLADGYKDLARQLIADPFFSSRQSANAP